MSEAGEAGAVRGRGPAGAAELVAMRWWHVAAATVLEAELFGATAWTAETFWSELARPESRWYTAALGAGEELLGYAGLMVTGAEADVQTVAVAPAAQGGGLGSRLLRRLLDQAAQRGARTVLLEMAAGNGAARRLYARNGFEQIARRAGYYGPGADAVIMRRVLG
jgi:ribosomal-protein-alanine N-acetyltransferase